MTHKEFDKGLQKRISLINNVLASKSAQYSTSANKLHNFKRTAEMNRETPTRSLHGMVSKHLTAYLDMVDKIDKGETLNKERVEEVLGDIINYFILQEQLIYENYIN